MSLRGAYFATKQSPSIKKFGVPMLPLSYYLALSVVLFSMGVVGVLVRRNAIVIFMSLELMFNAANLAFVAFARYYLALNGQLFVFFVMTVAAAEVAVGLALIVTIFRSKKSIDVDQMSSLKG
jgi:NADH-quinone oxidoreductase subunit K